MRTHNINNEHTTTCNQPRMARHAPRAVFPATNSSRQNHETTQGIIRRGLQVEALREYIIGQGASKNVTYQEWDKIWTINKRIIDPVAPRHTAVMSAGRVPVTITGAPDAVEVTEGPKHKKNPAVGTKKVLKLNRVGSRV
jgi:glutamyl/glutaminyl-tRNA synthetase